MTTLTEILAKAQPGQTIDLQGEVLTKAGCSVAHAFDPPVTIKRAVLRDSTIKNKKGLIFKDCDHVTTKVRNDSDRCEDIVYDGGTVREEGEAFKSRGITFRDSKNITVRGLNIIGLQYALIFWRVEGLLVEANRMTKMRTDAIRVQDCAGKVRLLDNDIYEFGETLSHPDGIQFFQQTRPMTDMLIARNRIARGNGPLFQGIFGKDEGGLGLTSGLRVIDNIVIGSMNNGIDVFGDAHVERNLVIADINPALVKQTTPMIAVKKFTGTLKNNSAAMYSLDSKKFTPSPDNVIVPRMTTAEAEAFAEAWVRANQLADNPPPAKPSPFSEEQEARIREIVRNRA